MDGTSTASAHGILSAANGRGDAAMLHRHVVNPLGANGTTHTPTAGDAVRTVPRYPGIRAPPGCRIPAPFRMRHRRAGTRGADLTGTGVPSKQPGRLRPSADA